MPQLSANKNRIKVYDSGKCWERGQLHPALALAGALLPRRGDMTLEPEPGPGSCGATVRFRERYLESVWCCCRVATEQPQEQCIISVKFFNSCSSVAFRPDGISSASDASEWPPRGVALPTAGRGNLYDSGMGSVDLW